MNDVNEKLINGSRSLSTMPLIFSEPPAIILWTSELNDGCINPLACKIFIESAVPRWWWDESRCDPTDVS